VRALVQLGGHAAIAGGMTYGSSNNGVQPTSVTGAADADRLVAKT
jgi:hypothetical protein